MENKELYDVTIIGGGPSGMYSAFYSGLRGLKTKLIEFQSELGGKMHAYPEKFVWDVGGVPPMPGLELMKRLTEQATVFNPTVCLNTKVESIEKLSEHHFVLHTHDGGRHESKAVIIAIGSGILKHKKLAVEGANRFEGTNLHYTIRSFKPFKNKTVIISGGGYTALDWATELEPIAKQVIISCRKEQMSGHEARIVQLTNSRAKFYFNTSITNVIPNADQSQIESVELTNIDTGEIHNVSTDAVVVSHGYEKDVSLMQNSALPIRMNDQRYIEGSPHCETTVSGIYAVGDVVTYDGKLMLIAGTFQDAANAVNKLKVYIDPTAYDHATVSSHHEAFKERNRSILQSILNEQ